MAQINDLLTDHDIVIANAVPNPMPDRTIDPRYIYILPAITVSSLLFLLICLSVQNAFQLFYSQ